MDSQLMNCVNQSVLIAWCRELYEEDWYRVHHTRESRVVRHVRVAIGRLFVKVGEGLADVQNDSLTEATQS